MGNEEDAMRLSRFVKNYDLPAYPGLKLLFSTRRTSLVMLEDQEYAALLRGEALPETMEQLAELGFLVNSAAEEDGEVGDFYGELNRFNPNLTVCVVLGMECNFNCIYCYEGILKGPHRMNDETADQLLAFVRQRFVGRKKRIHLDFYGGEPLLYVERIKYLAAPLKTFAEERGGTFDFNLVTNGSLLTKKLVEELREYGLVHAKVTVDGPPEFHDQSRPFKNGAPSFSTIVNNLREVSGLVDLGLSGNYTKDNYRHFPRLLDELTMEGLGPKELERVTFNMVMKTTDQFAPQEYSGGCASMNEPWLAEASLYLREEVLKRGFYVPPLEPEVCAIQIDDAFTVNHDGSLYKCLPLAGREKFKIGDVWRGIGDFRRSHHVDNWRHNHECAACDYLPLCYGGCRYMEYQRSGSMAKVDCLKEYFDRALSEILRQDVLYRYAAEPE